MSTVTIPQGETLVVVVVVGLHTFSNVKMDLVYAKKKKSMVIKVIVKSFKCKFIKKLIKYQKNLRNSDETRPEQEKIPK